MTVPVASSQSCSTVASPARMQISGSGRRPPAGTVCGAHGHLDQGGGHPFTRGADHPVALVLAVQVAFDPAQRFADGGPGDRVQREVAGDGAVEPGVAGAANLAWVAASRHGRVRRRPAGTSSCTALTTCPKVSSLALGDQQRLRRGRTARRGRRRRRRPAGRRGRRRSPRPPTPGRWPASRRRHGRGGGSVWRRPGDRLAVRDSRAHGARDPSLRHTPEPSQRAARRASLGVEAVAQPGPGRPARRPDSPSVSVSRSTAAAAVERLRGVLRRPIPYPHSIEHTFRTPASSTN